MSKSRATEPADEQRALRSVLSTVGARLFSMTVGVGTLVLTSRWLGAAGRGEFAAASTWVLTFATMGYLSMGLVVVHRATSLGGRQWLAPCLGTLLALALLISVLGSGIAFAMFWTSDGGAFGGLSGGTLAIAFINLPLLVWEQFGSSLLVAIRRLDVYNRAQWVGRAVTLLGLAVGMMLGGGVRTVLLVAMAGQAVVAISGIRVLLAEAGGRVRPDFKTAVALVSGGFRLHLSTVGMFLISSSSTLLVHRHIGPVETAHFYLATQLTSVFLAGPQAASQVLQGNVVTDGVDAVWSRQKKWIATVTLAMLPILACSWVVAPFAIRLALGPSFAPVASIFRMLIPTVVISTFAVLLTPQTVGRGYFWSMSLAAFVAGVVQLTLAALLIPTYRIMGAVIASYAASAVGGGGACLFLWRILRDRKRFTQRGATS